MFQSGLYGVFNNFTQNNGEAEQFSIVIGDVNYRVEHKLDESSQSYFIIHLPFDVNNADLALSHADYTLNESHFTVYAEQGGEFGILRPHYTGNFKNVSSGDNVVLRGYVGEGDGVAINTMRASTSHKNKKKQRVTKDVEGFFVNALDKKTFKDHIVASITNLMTFLRATQLKLVQPLVESYQSTLTATHDLSVTYATSQSADMLERCISLTTDLVATTSRLALIAEDPSKWQAICQLHSQQLEYYVALEARLAVEKEAELLVSREVAEEKQVTVETVSVAATVEAKPTIYVESQPQINALKELLADNLSIAKARELVTLVNDLNKKLFSGNVLAIDEQYDLLGLILESKKHLADYCYTELMTTDNADNLAEFAAMLPSTPSHVISSLISKDNQRALQALFEHGLISIYSLADDGKPHYVHAFELNSLNCITMYAKFGIHPVLMVANEVASVFSGTELNAGTLRRALVKYDRVNMHLQREVGISDWAVLLDNLLRSLRATRHDLVYVGGKGKRRAKRVETELTQSLSFIISSLEILQSVMKLFNEQDLARIGGVAQISSLQPLIDTLPARGMISLNTSRLMQIINPITNLLEKAKTALRGRDAGTRDNLRELFLQAIFTPQPPADKAFMTNMYKGMYEAICNSGRLSARAPKARHNEAVGVMLQLLANSAENMQSVLGSQMLPNMPFANVTQDSDTLRANIEIALRPESRSPIQKITDFVQSKMSVSHDEIDNLMKAWVQFTTSGGSLFLTSSAANLSQHSVVANSDRGGLGKEDDEQLGRRLIR